MNNVLNIIKNNGLTFEQKINSLAKEAENSVCVLDITEKTQEYLEKGVICDLFEGNIPFRPRYIVPDYEKFMKNGSKFLELTPPANIWEATNNLLILYKHVPSITTMPVYIGNIDYLLEPFILDENESKLAIKLFLKHIDSTITDSFCHANIGPLETKAGNIILEVMKELELPTPNLTLKYNSDTSQKFSIKAIETALVTAKPSFANEPIFTKDFKGDFGIVSCYNGLKIGGGASTLVRIRFGKLAKESKSIEDFFNKILPEVTKELLGYIDERCKFLMEESGFFESNFLVKEGLIEKEKFTGLAGVVGIADAVNYLLKSENQNDRFGYSENANRLGLKIIEEFHKLVNQHESKYAGDFFGRKHLLHAQVGIDTDRNESPGCRIPVGEEPPLLEHLVQSAPFHAYFPSGIGDIFVFDETYKKNPEAILDIIKGGFKENLRYFSLYSSECDVVRVTGYLVKKSEMNKLEKGESVLRDTEALGKGARDNGKALERRLRKEN